MSKRINWSGVFPAVTTQFNDDFSINLEKTHQVISNVIRDGVSGLVVCGSVGENTSLSAEEKIAVTEVAVDASRGRVPVICGVAEFTSVQAAKVANAVRKVGVDGVMLMPALVYGSKPFETAEHFRYVARHADVPLMVYNNPPIYKNDVTPDILISLADCDNVVCFKDSSGDTRRFIDVRNEVGDRFVLFAGLDDVVLESLAVGGRRLGLGHVQRVPAGRRDHFPPGPRRALRRSDADLRMADADPAPGRPRRPGAMHQAVRSHRRPRQRPHPPTAPGPAGSGPGVCGADHGQGPGESAGVAGCGALTTRHDANRR